MLTTASRSGEDEPLSKEYAVNLLRRQRQFLGLVAHDWTQCSAASDKSIESVVSPGYKWDPQKTKTVNNNKKN